MTGKPRVTVEPDHIPLTGYSRRADSDMRAAAEAYQALMAKRRSIRAFSPDPVPRPVIEACLKAAGSAPSGANHQPWHFVAISDADTKRRIRKAAEEEERAFYAERASADWLEALDPLGTDAQKPFLETAPWLIAVFAQRRGGVRIEDDRKNYYVTESVGLATGLLISALHAAGLGTLTHTPAPMRFLTEICGRPESEKPFVLLVVGHPAPDCMVPAHALIKKDLKDISTFVD